MRPASVGVRLSFTPDPAILASARQLQKPEPRPLLPWLRRCRGRESSPALPPRQHHIDQDGVHVRPFSHSCRSAARRFTSPGSSLPPAITQRLSSAHAPTKSPAFALRASVDLQNAPLPTLKAKLRNAAFWLSASGVLRWVEPDDAAHSGLDDRRVHGLLSVLTRQPAGAELLARLRRGFGHQRRGLELVPPCLDKRLRTDRIVL